MEFRIRVSDEAAIVVGPYYIREFGIGYLVLKVEIQFQQR